MDHRRERNEARRETSQRGGAIMEKLSEATCRRRSMTGGGRFMDVRLHVAEFFHDCSPPLSCPSVSLVRLPAVIHLSCLKP
eukprot:1194377-Prorocentrum_minimum.AAC.10